MGLKAASGVSQAQLDQAAASNLSLMQALIPAAQVNSDWSAVSGVSQALNKPTMMAVYRATSLRSAPVVYSNVVSTTSGVATFSVVDGSGNALFTNLDYLKAEVSDSTSSYNYSYVVSGDKKTVTVTVTRSAPTGVIALLGINILSAPVATPNGTSVNLIILGN